MRKQIVLGFKNCKLHFGQENKNVISLKKRQSPRLPSKMQICHCGKFRQFCRLFSPQIVPIKNVKEFHGVKRDGRCDLPTVSVTVKISIINSSDKK